MELFGLGKGAAPIGLDIGSRTFRIAQLKATAEKPILTDCSSVKAPQGFVNEGEVSDIDGVAKTLSSFWRSKKITEKKVVVGVANQKVIVRVVEMPAMTETELRGAIQYQINDYIPIPVEDAIIDFQIISKHENERQEKVMDVILVAARKDMVQNTVAAVEGAGLKPVIVDVSSLAFARAIVNNHPMDAIGDEVGRRSAVAMVNINSTLSDIVVTENDVPRFTRVSGIGGDMFTEAIVDQLGMSFDEAEDLKIRIGLPPLDGEEGTAGDETDISRYESAVHNILEQEIVKLIAEIRRSLDYYLVQASHVRSIDKIIITGGGAKLNNFMDHLKENLQIDVEMGRPLQNVQVSKKLLMAGIEYEELSVATCIGLAMRGIER